MNLGTDRIIMFHVSIPRVSGGEPKLMECAKFYYEYSPRERG